MHSEPLSLALKAHTAAAHERAEESPFVLKLMAGLLDADAYRALLVQNYVIYEALEAVVPRWRTDERIGGFVDRRLDRLPALESDLAHHFGPYWPAQLIGGMIPVTDAALNYAELLRERGARSPLFILAHHYVRYLGDLSGGQIIARQVSRAYGLTTAGLTFYGFPEIPKPKVYKDEYRTRLDELGTRLRDVETDELLRHAEEAFELNREIFIDLAREAPAAAELFQSPA